MVSRFLRTPPKRRLISRRSLLIGGASLIAAPYIARAGTISLLGAGKVSSGGGAYVGPGDLASGAKMWAGLRSYSAAYATGSNPAIDIVDQAGANPLTVNILANGNLDLASISAWVTAHSVTGIKIAKLYDQTGNGFHLTNTSLLASKPDLILSGIGTGPAYDLQFVAANSSFLSLTSFGSTIAQPYTVSCVARTTSTSASDIFGDSSATINASFFHVAGKVFSFAGTNADTTAATFANNTPYAMQFLFNGASSTINVNGSNSPLANSPGTNAFAASGVSIGLGNVFAFFDGNLPEFGIWPSDITGSGIGANQKTYWGF